jgi:hypothetical protein
VSICKSTGVLKRIVANDFNEFIPNSYRRKRMKVTFDLPIEEVAKAFRPERPLSEEELHELLEYLQQRTDWKRLINLALMFTVE